ncbi:MAG TPA: type II toxin-antitoxin system VapC family toxin [Armatimonadota bacterium]|nr:type II toxin-antitoxin system VapC family toxin [Armatimonadota bacterium]
MKLLLDTHALIWFAEDAPQMPNYAKALLEDVHNEKWVSVASVWEIAIKHSLGKLLLASPPEKYLTDILDRGGMSLVPVLFEHAVYVGKLGAHHRDPFDRLIVAQSTLETMALVSGDAILDLYGITRLWDAPEKSTQPKP